MLILQSGHVILKNIYIMILFCVLLILHRYYFLKKVEKTNPTNSS